MEQPSYKIQEFPQKVHTNLESIQEICANEGKLVNVQSCSFKKVGNKRVTVTRKGPYSDIEAEFW